MVLGESGIGTGDVACLLLLRLCTPKVSFLSRLELDGIRSTPHSNLIRLTKP